MLLVLETKWGLGLENIADLPAGNIYNFGLVGLMTEVSC
jgi:hypothetical protein